MLTPGTELELAPEGTTEDMLTPGTELETPPEGTTAE
jgi:hypothetical protein